MLAAFKTQEGEEEEKKNAHTIVSQVLRSRSKRPFTMSAISLKSCYVVLEKIPPDYLKKISQYPHCSQSPVSAEGPAKPDSDSGDSLFLTQKPSQTRKLQKSDPEDSGGDSTSSHGDDGRESSNMNSQKIILPKYSFSFPQKTNQKPKRRKFKKDKNMKFHNYLMGGFIKYVHFWQRSRYFKAKLRTVDQAGEDIPPLTEDEADDTFGGEGIRVVENTCFAVRSKAARSQPWYTAPPGTEKGSRECDGRSAFTQTERMSAGLSWIDAGAPSPRNHELQPPQRRKKNKLPSRSKSIHFREELNDAADLAGNEPVSPEKSQVDTLSNEQLSGEEQDPVSEVNDELNNTENEGGETDLHGSKDDIAAVKPKKKKKKKRQEENGSLKDARVFTAPVDCGEHQSKKAKRKRGDDPAEEFSSRAPSEPPSGERLKKKKKKRPLALIDGAESHSVVTAASPKRKKKKKHPDSAQEDDDPSEKAHSDAASFTGSAKKKREVSSRVSNGESICSSPDQTGDVADKTLETTQRQDAELGTKKKKKRKSWISNPEDCGPRS